MGFEDVLSPTEFRSHEASQNAAQRPLKKKQSLTRLFTTSRSSSRSRAPSIDEEDVPSTPIIPEQYLSTSRKASNCETPSAISYGKVQSVQPLSKDTAGGSDDRSDARTHGFRGILKPKPKVAQGQGNSSDCDGAVSPTAQSRIRPRESSTSFKRRKEKPTVQPPSKFPQARKGSDHHEDATNASSPRGRTRGASAVSLGVKNLQKSDYILTRPSTSGGDRGWTTGDIGSGSEDFQGLELNPIPSAAPAPLNSQEIRASLRSAMTTASSILEPSTARSSVMTKESDTTVESPPRDLEDEGMTVDEAIGMYEKGFMDDDSDHDVRSASLISEEERRRSMRIAEAINDTISPHTGNDVFPSILTPLKPATASPGPPLKDEPRRAPSIMLPTNTRDQYGFLKGSRYVNATQFNTWEGGYAPEQFRRAKKWL
ncbi:MAG: hypothetical protein Q9172_005650 [Xanthocarpia lactea]